jgi:hypothetical protein
MLLKASYMSNNELSFSVFFIRLSTMLTLMLMSTLTLINTHVFASDSFIAVDRVYAKTPNAPMSQTAAQMAEKSRGCVSCHTKSDAKTMHANPAVKLGCVDCHGGNTHVVRQSIDGKMPLQDSEHYLALMTKAHVLPKYPAVWKTPSSANPKQSYTILNKESPEFIRFVNPSDNRVARKACGSCHLSIIEAAERSLMATSAMLWGGAAYNNGILPYKRYILGESYMADGKAAKIMAPIAPTKAMQDAGILPFLLPLPAWETVKPADNFRVFERGGRNISNLFPEVGLPNPTGLIQRLEEPGKPDNKQSNRGAGTGGRIAVPLINITKTRLNDPHTGFMGTNDQPGDYRHSGCASCHVIYANDREPKHSSVYAKYGHKGQSATVDPTIDKLEKGHPIKHQFTRAIPSSQCMSCHMHQPNMFMNTYFGYTMWDYESDAGAMWPKEQHYPTDEEIRKTYERNPEGAAARGKWRDLDFLEKVSELNGELKDTQFADYHGHGWNFRAVFKRDRKGNLLDDAGEKVSDDDPKKFDKAVHMSSIHLDKGMQCVDCHFSQDNHGNGHIYGEVAAAIEIDCVDCHGTTKDYPNLFTSGPAALNGGLDLSALRNPDGKKRFEWQGDTLIQRSVVDTSLEWNMSLVKDSVNPKHNEFNAKAARSKLMGQDTKSQQWSQNHALEQLAHSNEKMECYSCHTSWTTSCGGCHLPIEANAKTDKLHYEGGESRNYATYNPQVARDQMFLLGKRGSVKGGKIAPVRSTSALVLSSTNANREKIYIQQPPIASSGYSSQAFNPHFPHTTRKTETKTCTDCHLSEKNDNNAIMAQLLMLGTQYVNFIGHFAWVGSSDHVTGVQVTQWQEPQAVIGSYLEKFAYPDFFKQHQDRNQQLTTGHEHNANDVNCVQLRGEYLYTSQGTNGVKVLDVANIANKGFSQRIVDAPFSPLGHNTTLSTKNATCVVLPTNQPINPPLNTGKLMRVVNQEQPMHPIYNYALVTDSIEGLVLFNVNTLVDGELRNNFFKRAVTFNPANELSGARHMILGGYYAYILTDKAMVVVNLNNPLNPKIVTRIAIKAPHSIALQFRYLFVTNEQGLSVIDITKPEEPRLVDNNTIAMKQAKRIHLARTYAYVAAGKQGIAIIDITNPEKLKLDQFFSADGNIVDARDITVAMTNASLFGYVADGVAGLKVVQLYAPDTQPKFYGFSPSPEPRLIAHYPTKSPALALSRGLERDRGVDETGGQIAVFGRLGSRPLNFEEMKKLYLDTTGNPWFVKDKADD